jgi:hypothetical protein
MNQCLLKETKTIADCPKLLKFWHPTKNGNLTPKDVTIGSDKYIYWICDKGVLCDHEWKTRPRKVIESIQRSCGCPYCSGRKVCLDNCLTTTHPELVKFWHPTKNGNLTPNDVTIGSNKKIHWLCDKGVLCDHEWKTQPKTLITSIQRGNGCPYCSGRKVCLDNCLTTTHPELANEWHPTKNGDLTPNDVTAGSKKKIHWLCKKHGSFLSIIKDRKRGSGCPICNESKGEKKIAKILEEMGLLFKRQLKLPSCKNIKELPFDFLVKINNKKGFLIEYQGKQHYKPIRRSKLWTKEMAIEELRKTQKNDKIKLEYTKKSNIPLLIIPYWDHDNIEQIIENFIESFNSHLYHVI